MPTKQSGDIDMESVHGSVRSSVQSDAEKRILEQIEMLTQRQNYLDNKQNEHKDEIQRLRGDVAGLGSVIASKLDQVDSKFDRLASILERWDPRKGSEATTSSSWSSQHGDSRDFPQTPNRFPTPLPSASQQSYHYDRDGTMMMGSATPNSYSQCGGPILSFNFSTQPPPPVLFNNNTTPLTRHENNNSSSISSS